MDSLLLKEEFSSVFPNQRLEIKNINKVAYFCVPVSSSSEHTASVPQFDQSKDYFYECEELRKRNEDLGNEIDSVNSEIRTMKEEIMSLERSQPPSRVKTYQSNRKRDRRKSGQILRAFKCEFCEKSYGSEGSLNHHVRLKHFEQFQEIHLEKALQMSEYNH